ncbi:MAG: S8 family serine peptidase [Bacteroidota bacterium]
MKVKKGLLLLALCGLSAFGQTDDEKRKIREAYDKKELIEAREELSQYMAEQNQKVEELIESGIAERFITNSKGKEGELVRVDRDGNPIYYFTDNADAATSTRTIFLYENGGLGLDLRGEDMAVGVWDQQMAYSEHVEFIDENGDSRIEMLDGFETNHGFHATHVTGTIAAAGFNDDAKGMATEVTVHSYDWGSDASELSNEAIDGLLVSNHSYGQPVENTSPENIGKYTFESRAWDLMTYGLPYLLPVISAGNDGTTSNSNPLANGYDKLIGNKVSKNALIIANANDVTLMNNGSGDIAFSPNINPGSSQGPADDGRIKPDVAGNGQGVFSTSNQNPGTYGSATGTSMSAPNVAGTLILLQELYGDEYDGNYMLSSTLRGLTCHTATDAGDTGPDPKFGWGIVDAKFAAETILKSTNSETKIEEYELQDGETYSFTVRAKGDGELKASVTWTDRRGEVNDGSANDDTPALVNDIDLRIINEDTDEEFLPWRLNLNNLFSGAQKGDNTVDNIEVVEVDDQDNSLYTIEITHKGTLASDSQMISIIVTGTENTLSTNDIEKEELSVWPNPADNYINLSLSNVPNEISYELFDITGRRIQSGDLEKRQSQQIDLSNINSGNYILKVNTNEGVYREKIIKK